MTEAREPEEAGRFEEQGSSVDEIEAVRVAGRMMDDLMRPGRVDAAFGQPQTIGDRTIIPVARVGSGGGFGVGLGGEPVSQGRNVIGSGGGGGGGAMANPMAVIVVTPEEVRVQPIIDVTQLGLAALASFAFSFFWIVRLVRGIRGVQEAEAKQTPLSLGRMRKLLGF